jgi:lysophospholipase L1-like esterase
VKKKYVIAISVLLVLVVLVVIFYNHTEKIRLTALGDSITYGVGDPSKRGYIERVKSQLEEKKDLSVQVNNFGVPKYTTEDILRLLNERKVKKAIKKADYVILYVGTNDFRQSAGYKFHQLHVEKINKGKQKFLVNLNAILERFRSGNPSAPIIVLGLYQPYIEYQNSAEIEALIEDWNSEINYLTGNFDKTYFIPTLDLFADKPKETYFNDLLHPNPNGYELIAGRVLEKIFFLEETSQEDR